MFVVMIISVVYALLVVSTDYAVVDVGRIGIFGHGEIGSSWFLLAGCDGVFLADLVVRLMIFRLYIRHE